MLHYRTFGTKAYTTIVHCGLCRCMGLWKAQMFRRKIFIPSSGLQNCLHVRSVTQPRISPCTSSTPLQLQMNRSFVKPHESTELTYDATEMPPSSGYRVRHKSTRRLYAEDQHGHLHSREGLKSYRPTWRLFPVLSGTEIKTFKLTNLRKVK